MFRLRSKIVSAHGAVILVGLILALSTRMSYSQVSPEKSAKMLKPAEGLEATLWASEPMVVNPTNIDIDSRGRVWVTEGLNYRLTRGGNREFKRIEGADKIKILADTDHDGRADKMTVFADNIFPVPMGIAVEEHWSKEGKYEGAKVFIGNSPDLLVLEDTNGDDVADKRYPLLTGFGGIDSDHGVHGMTLGPDGKLYFTHGDGCCSVQQDKSERQQNFDVIDKSGRRVATDQLGTVLRCNRDGTQLEILATRLRNDYECAVDSFGNVFASDNDDDGNRGSRIVWIMDGGNYGYRTPGSRLHWGEDVPGIIPKIAGTGNGSPCGVMVYEGDALPALYRGALLEAEAGPRVINAFPLKPVGAGFRTETHVMLSSDDDWFRPVDVCAAPDGSVMVADWYDGGVGGHAFRDQSTGRIYRVSAKGTDAKPVAYDFATVSGASEALKSPNLAARDAAARRLSQVTTSPLPAADYTRLAHGRNSTDSRVAARFVWVDPNAADEIENARPEIREQVVRMLGRDNGRLGLDPSTAPLPGPRALEELEELLGKVGDADAGVRRELILALRNVDTPRADAALKRLAASWDGQDRFYLEALGLALRNREPEFIKSLFDGTLYGDLALETNGKTANVAVPPYFPVDRNEAYLKPDDTLPPANALSKTLGLMWGLHRVESLSLLAKLMPSLETADLQQAADDIIAQISDESGAPIVADMIAQLNDDTRKNRAMASLARKLDGPWRGAAADSRVTKVIETGLASEKLRNAAIALAAASGDQRYAEALTKLVGDDRAAIDSRVAALDALARLRAANAGDLANKLVSLASDTQKSSPLAEAAMRALGQMGEGSDKLGLYMKADTMPLPLRREALRGLAQRRDDVGRLLDMARSNDLPADLRLEAATVLRSHPDRGIRDQALELFPIKAKGGKPLPSTGELMRRDGDAARGKAVFFATEGEAEKGTKTACASCHRVQGEGQWIGPDLSTIGTKYGKDELLNSILNPSAAISYTFRTLVLALNDGRVLTGLLLEETPGQLLLKTAEGQRVYVEKSAIEERRDGDLSLMPEGLAEGMSEQDLVDLIAYLKTLTKPVSIVGEVRFAGPWQIADVTSDLRAPLRADKPLANADGTTHAWQSARADTEGTLMLREVLNSAIAVHVPIQSPTAQTARLVIGGGPVDAVWLDGKLVKSGRNIRSVELALPRGASDLNLHAQTSELGGSLELTIVTDEPVSFASAGVVGD